MAAPDMMTIQMEMFQRHLFLGARGETTSAGNVGGTTLIDTARTEVNDFWNDHFSIKILNGANIGEIRQIIDFDAASDTITVDRAFTAQVASTVGYIIRADPYSIQGANSADNLVDTSAVAGNIDGSQVERTESVLKALQVVAAAGTGFEEDGSGATLYNTLIAVESITDGAATTATIVDSTRTEGADYWNGNLVVMLAGAAAGQVRTIVDDTGAGTLTVEPILSAASGTGNAYVILNQKTSDWIMGDNTADNTYASDLITVNHDGSGLERLEGLLSNIRSRGYVGNIYFVSTAGNDSWDGLTIATAFLTIDYAVGQCTSFRHDAIVVLPGGYDEVAKTDGVQVDAYDIGIFGVGRWASKVYNSNGAATSVFNVSNRCEIENIQITEITTTVEGIVVTGANANNTKINGCFFNGAMENGVRVSTPTFVGVEKSVFYGITNDGVELADGDYSIIENNYFSYVLGNAIHVNSATSDGIIICNNTINGSNGDTDVGIQITAGDNTTVMNNYVGGCTAQIVDGGTNTYLSNNHESYTKINNTTLLTNDDARQAFATILAADGTNVFNPTIDGVARTDLETALEALAGMITEIGGMALSGTVSAATDVSNFKIAELSGYGDDFFNTDWVCVCVHNADNDGVAPEGEYVDITDYVSSDGSFVTVAFTGAPTTGDEMMVIRRELLLTDAVALKTTPATNSLAYRLSQYIASGDGDWAGGTPLASNKSLVDVIGTDGSAVLSHNFSENGLLQYMHGFHTEAVILFVIPEAIASINAHNTAILVELQKCGEVVTITQDDALIYPDFEGISICVLGTDNGTAWVLANLADIKTIPDLPLLSCDSSSAAYFEIGTDGGDAAAKTAINAIANIKGTILGTGLHDITGLAVGANTVSSSTTFNTLDMSDADLTETWYAYETANANTDVVIGELRRVQPDGSIGIDETGAEVAATTTFYGCAYSANDLNTLGKATLQLLVTRLIEGVTIGSSLTISGDVGNLETKLLGNMTTKHSNATPLAAFISGNTGGTGTELPNSKSLYDLMGSEYVDGGGNPDVDTIRNHLQAGLLNGTGTAVAANKSLRDYIGTAYLDGGGVFNVDSVWDDLRTIGQYLIDGTAGAEAGTVLPAGQSLYDVLNNGAVKNTMINRDMPWLTEYWWNELLDGTVWETIIDGTGTEAFAVDDGYMYYDMDTQNLADADVFLNSKYRWRCRPATFSDTNSTIEKLVLEWVARTTGVVADVTNVNFVMGFAETKDNDNTDNNLAAFTLVADALTARTDNDGTEEDTAPGGETLTNWNKYKIEVYDTGYKFYLNEALIATHTTQVPDEAMYIVFGTRSDGVGAVGLEIDNVKCFYYEVV